MYRREKWNHVVKITSETMEIRTYRIVEADPLRLIREKICKFPAKHGAVPKKKQISPVKLSMKKKRQVYKFSINKSKINSRKCNPEQRDSAKRPLGVGKLEDHPEKKDLKFDILSEEQVYKSGPSGFSFKKSKRNSLKGNPLSIGKLQKVSEALGLRRNFLNEVMSIPDDILWHRGVKGFLLKFIESVFFDIEPEEQSLKLKLSEELLKQVGFTDSEVINTIMRRSEKMRCHLDPIDVIKRYVKDEFKYNPNLTEYATEDETIPDDTEVLPFSDYRNDEQNEHCEFVRLFHGTDLCSAVDIMKNIELYYGRRKHDFSDGIGFYLTTSFEHAETWARSLTSHPVVLEFKIPKTCLDKARTLSLDVSKKQGRSEWDRVVRENRSGRSSKKLRQEIKEYDCIEGPISVPSEDAGSTCFKPESGSYQLCVVKRSFTKVIQNNTKYTLYTELQE